MGKKSKNCEQEVELKACSEKTGEREVGLGETWGSVGTGGVRGGQEKHG